MIKKIGGPVGFSSQDQQMWLDFVREIILNLHFKIKIMEAAGVIEDAEKIEKVLSLAKNFLIYLKPSRN